MGEGPHIAQHPLLGVLPDGAGVDDDYVRRGLVLSKAVPHLGEVPPDALGVGLVLLAAVGVHKGQRPGREGGVHGLDLGAEILLSGDLLPGDPCGGLIQSGASIGKQFFRLFYHFPRENTRVESASPFTLSVAGIKLRRFH